MRPVRGHDVFLELVVPVEDGRAGPEAQRPGVGALVERGVQVQFEQVLAAGRVAAEPCGQGQVEHIQVPFLGLEQAAGQGELLHP